MDFSSVISGSGVDPYYIHCQRRIIIRHRYLYRITPVQLENHDMNNVDMNSFVISGC